MKRLFCLLLSLLLLLSLCACRQSYGSIDLKDPVTLPENGILDALTVSQIKNENAIAVFQGSCGDFRYEWTLFGSAIEEVKSVNLLVSAEKGEGESLRVSLGQEGAFGFSASLAIHLNERWSAQSGAALAEGVSFSSVFVTGSDHTILNISLDGSVKSFVLQGTEPTEKDDANKSEAPTREDGPESNTAEQSETPATTPSGTSGATVTKPATTTKKTENGGKDKYFTDPVPEGKPNPVEPEDQKVDENVANTCTFSIECSTILNNLSMLNKEKLEMVPSDGVILAKVTVVFYEGESVFDILQRVCRENNVHIEASWTPMYNSAYVEGIHNLYEFDCGDLSGWMYKVNGWYPNYGSSRYVPEDGDEIEWRYTCDLGNDIGGGYAIGG